MTQFSDTAQHARQRLDELYQWLGEWLPISTAIRLTDGYFRGHRSEEDIRDYRMARPPLKKLAAEVVPTLRHLVFAKITGDVRFSLSDDFPDVWVRQNGVEQGIEVTGALARAQVKLAAQLNAAGSASGFLSVQDEVPEAGFAAALARERIMHAPSAVRDAVILSIKRRIERKSADKYAGHDLLISAPLRILSQERWTGATDELRQVAKSSPFREIHVIGNSDHPPFGFQVK